MRFSRLLNGVTLLCLVMSFSSTNKGVLPNLGTVTQSSTFDDEPIIFVPPPVELSESTIKSGQAFISDQVVVDYGADGPGTIEPTGRFIATCSLLGGILSAAGDSVVINTTPDGYNGVAEGKTVFTLVINPSTGEYTYTQVLPFDHGNPNASGHNDMVCFDFEISAEDSDGDISKDDINIYILDDESQFVVLDTLLIDETGLRDGALTFCDTLGGHYSVDTANNVCGYGIDVAGSLLNGIFSSNGIPILAVWQEWGGYGLANADTVYTYSLNQLTDQYCFTLFRSIDHDDDSNIHDAIFISFYNESRDFDGDRQMFPQATARATVNINNDDCFVNASAQTIGVTDCDVVEVNGISYDSTGTYVQILTNELGCDSTLTIQATIVPQSIQTDAIVTNTLDLEAYGFIEFLPQFSVLSNATLEANIFTCPD